MKNGCKHLDGGTCMIDKKECYNCSHYVAVLEKALYKACLRIERDTTCTRCPAFGTCNKDKSKDCIESIMEVYKYGRD